eukprot:c5789_g1_i2.p1 GENE.c5789_g1_i2~~c5789_g1_i2.p1  ORF type:complete len:910 (+),score=251.08 c5789_g1_i2:234-2963(+)
MVHVMILNECAKSTRASLSFTSPPKRIHSPTFVLHTTTTPTGQAPNTSVESFVFFSFFDDCRKEDMFPMLWQEMDWRKVIDREYLAAVAPFGGPIAMVRDMRKSLSRQGKGPSPVPLIRVYNSSGVKLAEFVASNDGFKPLKLGWTSREELVCVLDNGYTALFTCFGEPKSQFHLGKDVSLNGIKDVLIWSTGLVVLTHNNQLLVVKDFNSPPTTYPALPASFAGEITCMTVLEPRFNQDGNATVLVGTKSQANPNLGTVYVVTPKEARDQELQQEPFAMMTISPNGKFLAAFTQSSKVLVMLTNFTKNLSELTLRTSVAPAQMVWCGTDALGLYFSTPNEHSILMVGPYKDNIKHVYDCPLMLVPESDGIRVLTNYSCEFIQMVPKCLEEIFRIGSQEPVATLYDAWCQFVSHDPKADETIRGILDLLPDTVDVCIEAAGHEFSAVVQKQLLSAASYGKAWCEWYNADTFVDKCKTLRVLNMLRRPDVGRPLTIQQYETLGAKSVIALLINQHAHAVAHSICKYLSLDTDLERSVLLHWACAKIKAACGQKIDPIQLRDEIVSKLKGCPGVSYAEVASNAHANGLPDLAELILDFEPRASEQVPLLISWRKNEEALRKAVLSGDTDLVYLALLNLRDQVKIVMDRVKGMEPSKAEQEMNEAYENLFRIVASMPLASNMFVLYCREMMDCSTETVLDVKCLQSYNFYTNRMEEAGLLLIQEAYKRPELNKRAEFLTLSLKFFEKAKDKEGSFYHKATTDEMRLLEHQRELTARTNRRFIDMSISDTIFNCHETGNGKKATEISKEFKVPEKRFWIVKAKALAFYKNFDELDNLANSKKSPVGYQIFFDVCLEQGQATRAESYIPKLPDANAKVNAYLALGKIENAMEIARVSKDPQLVEQVEREAAKRR